jgi:hypothetical protein
MVVRLLLILLKRRMIPGVFSFLLFIAKDFYFIVQPPFLDKE